MAFYKYGNYLQQQNGFEFDAIHSPGDVAPYSGIYRCEVCGGSAVSTVGNRLPPQGHHPHANSAPIRWKLIIKTHFK
ncbi:hypothetical protein [Burkholderia multivorans]|uniref:hypothetical protein n=1 Tax=Burkholderia multivorans TaxID=87883 RepID=UPI000CFEB130|nr:hypothetical protein [Burkholderia multivorans]MBU9142906.1 hypothetical protein [Burkholderia multivorans]MDN7477760.1 hypothetical protein [Burkholderia multivorans]PRD98592.1 hypothetical protein C6P91_31295 [Burkholderia multivorans]